jgi:hypothetical protein
MKRALIETLFKAVYLNFEGARMIVPTFLQLELDNMAADGLEQDVAAKVYDRQVKKLEFLVRTLNQFPGDTPAECEDATVVILLEALFRRIQAALEIIKTHDNAHIRKAWEQTALRQANLSHAARNSFSAIIEFTKANKLNLKLETTELFLKVMVLENKNHFGIGSYAKTSGLGGFITPAVQTKTVSVVTSPKPPKITIRRS